MSSAVASCAPPLPTTEPVPFRASAASTALAPATPQQGPSTCSALRSNSLGFVADFVSSWTATAVSLVFSHPIDTIRVRRQTQMLSARETIAQHGLRSLYNGLPTPLITTGPSIATAFAFNDFFKRLIASLRFGGDACDTDRLALVDLALAGALAGLCSSVVQCPLSVVRIQQQVDTSARSRLGLRGTVREVFAHAGMRGFYRGLPSEAVQCGLGRLVYFSTYNKLKKVMEPVLPGLPGQVVAAVGASWMGWVVIYPFDVIKNRVQSDALRSDSGLTGHRRYRGLMHCATTTFKELGWRGMWMGFSATLARGVVSSGISLPGYDMVRPHVWRAFNLSP